MNEKKYILTDDTINFLGHTLHRIQAVKEFGDVKAGDLGGWIEYEENLSQKGICWVFDDAKVFDKARLYDEAKVSGKVYVSGEAKVFGKVCVSGKAKVFGKACVSGEAKVFGKACIYGEARVFGKARVSGEVYVFGKTHVCDEAKVFGMACVRGAAWVFEKACVYDKAEVFGKACIYGEAKVFDRAEVYDKAEVFGKAVIAGTTILRTTAYVQSQYDLLSIENIGSRNGPTTFYKTKEGSIDVACGCFGGSIEEFEKAVEKTHGDNEHGRVYRHAVNYAKVVLT